MSTVVPWLGAATAAERQPDRMVAELAAAEEAHWWYAGLRNLIRRLLRLPQCRLPEHPAVLDIGCGTGANLRLLAEALQPRYLGGFDLRPRCVAEARAKCPAAEVYRSDLRAPVLRRSSYDLALCCDVLSSAGLSACKAGLRQIVDRLSPGGLLLLHLPACPWLASPHDWAVGTIERYRPREVAVLLRDLELAPVIFGYRMAAAFPAIAAMRLARRWLHQNSQAAPQSDLSYSGGLGSGLLRLVVAAENALLCRGVRWPIGSSIVAVARRE